MVREKNYLIKKISWQPRSKIKVGIAQEKSRPMDVFRASDSKVRD